MLRTVFLRPMGWAVLVLALTVTGCVPLDANPDAVYVEAPPPPPRVEVIPIAPGPILSWVPGRWAWRPQVRRYTWVPGHYVAVRHPHQRRWVPGHWVRTPRGNRYVRGHWR